jgi:hypothetical protein
MIRWWNMCKDVESMARNELLKIEDTSVRQKVAHTVNGRIREWLTVTPEIIQDIARDVWNKKSLKDVLAESGMIQKDKMSD